ncbi:MAG: phosphoribosyltransferase family protein [Desulfovibrionaceae bacterium]
MRTNTPLGPSAAKVFATACRWWHAGRAVAELRCPACYAPFSPSKPDSLLCPSCEAQLTPYTGALCPLCGLPAIDPAGPCVPCGHCLTTPPIWTQLAFHGLYRHLLQSLLVRLKYHADFSLVPVLSAMLCQAYARMSPCQTVLAVPQYPSHLRERGFNQAHELARALARRTRLRLAPQSLTRTRITLAQTRLNARQRQDNPKNSFAAHDVAGMHILLVDDTMTTGSTLHHATKALLAAKAASVSVVIVARTPPPSWGTGIKAHDN